MDQAVLSNLPSFAIQVCVVAAVATLALRILPIASAGTRYACWRLALLVCLVMPFALRQTVAVEPVASDLTGATQVSDVVLVAGAGSLGVSPTTPASPGPPPIPWAFVVAGVIVAGAGGRAIWLGMGLLRLRALRRQGTPSADVDFARIQETLGTQAMLISVEGLTQPATFGVRRPVVLLPATLADAPHSVRTAVLTHELFHVQRRDWLWVLSEEIVRTLLWFHPAIAWLTSRIQLAREELVDELTVLAIGNRRAYIQALLVFADAGRLQPAPAFARRRHLFTRILRLSTEKAMSSSRIVLSFAVVIGIVLSAGWSAGRVFPIVSAASVPAAPAASAPAADPQRSGTPSSGAAVPTAAPQGPRGGGAARPGPPPAPARVAVQANQVTPENPIPRRVYSVPVSYPQELQGSGISAAVEVRVTVDRNGVPALIANRISIAMSQPDGAWLAARSGAAGNPSDVESARAQLAAMVAAQGTSRDAFTKAVRESVGQWRYDAPAQAPLEFSIAVTFAAGQDGVVTQSAEARGVSAINGRGVGVGLAGINGNPVDPAGRVSSAQLAQLDARQLELLKRRGDAVVQFGPEHPDTKALDAQLSALAAERAALVASLQQQSVTAAPYTPGQPIRVGGNIKPPAKTKHVNPVYPPDAQAERVQGVVIIEATIDETGHVSNARILRSIPLLDLAALEAVQQWEFAPTLLNGAAVPVIMTVTVQFSLN